MTPSLHGPRDGATYTPADTQRLNRQATDVWAFMADRRWHTLREMIAAEAKKQMDGLSHSTTVDALSFAYRKVQKTMAATDALE